MGTPFPFGKKRNIDLISIIALCELMSVGEKAKPLLISCGALKEEIDKLVEDGSLDAELIFLDMTLHNDYNVLERKLKLTIEESLQNFPRRIVLIYGDLCLGRGKEMKKLADNYHVVKVDALNCIDCLLGGKGKILEIDPEQVYFFLNPGMIKVWNRFKLARCKAEYKDEFRKMFSDLRGIILLDSVGDLDSSKEEIEEFSSYTGLPILERKNVGLENLREVISEAIKRLKD